MRLRVPLNDLSRYVATVSPRVEQVMRRIVRGGHFILGHEVENFEREFAAYCGTEDCIGVANGTDALEIALRANGISAGDEVLLTANAGGYGTAALRAIGAHPRYVDVREADGLMDASALAKAVTSGRPKAVLVTHLYGRLAEMQRIVSISRDAALTVIEDCAQAHGATCPETGIRAGAFGSAGCFSFYPTKNLGAFGDGGAIVSNDAGASRIMRRLRQYGWSEKYDSTTRGGRNSRLDALQAGILRELLGDLDRRNVARRQISLHYSQRISHPNIRTPTGASATSDVAHLYVIRSDRRDSLRRHLASQGIETAIHYPTPDYRQSGLNGDGAVTPLTQSERACTEVLTLPCFPEMTTAEVDAVVAAANAWNPS
jgi:dTDP-4-amino-4,6-dideoxygalactose transaminase